MRFSYIYELVCYGYMSSRARLQDIVNNVAKWVVTVDIMSTKSKGSGVIIDGHGHIVTNHHVMKGAENALITSFGSNQSREARLLGSDSLTDIAVLEVESSNLEACSIADSDSLEIGQEVLAIGNPMGLGLTVTFGIISGLGRSIAIADTDLAVDSLIQTDAAINPGNSGGALVRIEDRKVVGINVAGWAGQQSIGFVVPMNIATATTSEILRNGSFTRPALGFTGIDLNPAMAQYYGLGVSHGVLVQEVTENSSASKSGLRENDVILRAEGSAVQSLRDFARVYMLKHKGQNLSLSIKRNSQDSELVLQL